MIISNHKQDTPEDSMAFIDGSKPYFWTATPYDAYGKRVAFVIYKNGGQVNFLQFTNGTIYAQRNELF